MNAESEMAGADGLGAARIEVDEDLVGALRGRRLSEIEEVVRLVFEEALSQNGWEVVREMVA